MNVSSNILLRDSIDNYYFLVLEVLGPSLEMLFEKLDNNFSLKNPVKSEIIDFILNFCPQKGNM